MKRNTIATIFAHSLLNYAEEEGLKIKALLQDSGLPLDLLEKKNSRIPIKKWIKLWIKVIQQTRDEAFGGVKGKKVVPGSHALLASAVVHSCNLGEALEKGFRFSRFVYDGIDFDLITDDQFAYITIESTELHEPSSIFLVELAIFVWYRFASWLIGQRLELSRIHWKFDETKYLEEYNLVFQCLNIAFNQKNNQLIFPIQLLQLPVVQNEKSLSKVLENSAEQLFSIPIGKKGVNHQVEEILTQNIHGVLANINDIAKLLGLSEATLRRRLKKEGDNFQKIKNKVRKNLAIEYLQKSKITLEDVALRVGFSETSAFFRAFKKWTGKSPSSYRE
ncbi:MAG: AraC-like DNA-binding protein [bacterium]|jgi:AraC-like DNA-binding protein